jgi:hypothetical protein
MEMQVNPLEYEVYLNSVKNAVPADRKTVSALQRQSVATVCGSNWLCNYIQHQLVSFFYVEKTFRSIP